MLSVAAAASERHPLSGGLARLRDLDPYLGARVGAISPDHVRLSDLFQHDEAVGDLLARVSGAYDDNRRVAANFLASGAAWAVTAAPLASAVLDRRGLAPHAAQTWVRILPDGEIEDCVYEDPRFCVLRSDALAADARADVVDDVEGLREWMRPRLAAPIAPLIDHLSQLARLSKRSLWAQVTSAWGSIIVWATEAAGRGELALIEAPALLAANGPVFSKKPSFYLIEHGERRIVAMRRAACCLAYKLPTNRYCGTCPLITDEERSERFCREAEVT